jgi:hypothetical protein
LEQETPSIKGLEHHACFLFAEGETMEQNPALSHKIEKVIGAKVVVTAKHKYFYSAVWTICM